MRHLQKEKLEFTKMNLIQLKEYIGQWREERQKEEAELTRLKEKQAKRKEIRAEQEKAMAKKKKEEEDKIRKEEAEKKAVEAAAKKKQVSNLLVLPWMLTRSWQKQRSKLRRNAKFL